MPRLRDIIGERKGRLVVLEEAYRNKYNIYMKCRCDCGNICYVGRKQILKKVGGTESCGCIRSEKSKERMHKIKPYMYNRQHVNKDKAVNVFDISLDSLATEYHIPQDVIDSYREQFRSKIGY